jgi:hypothetical protein
MGVKTRVSCRVEGDEMKESGPRSMETSAVPRWCAWRTARTESDVEPGGVV